MRRLVAAVMAGVVAVGAVAQTAAPASQDVQQTTGEGTYRLNLNTNIVLTNVVVRDK